MKLGWIRFQGLEVKIEKLWCVYGYIRGTRGKDNMPLDCFVGPDKKSKRVYLVTQNRSDKPGEVKAMLGFNSRNEARLAYLEKYSSHSIRRMRKISILKFKKELAEKWTR